MGNHCEALQWSHSLSAMETRVTRRLAIEDYASFNGATAFRPWKHGTTAISYHCETCPSMEPQPFGHGNLQGFHFVPPVLESFNGATAFRPWKLGNGYDLRVLGSCLQWSHSLSAMETRAWQGGQSGGLAAFNGATAFRPWKRALFRYWSSLPLDPSMEPQPFGHGNRYWCLDSAFVQGKPASSGASILRNRLSC